MNAITEFKREAESLFGEEAVVFLKQEDEPLLGEIGDSKEQGFWMNLIGLRPEDPQDGEEKFIYWEEVAGFGSL